jgi:hypothetical protein
MSLPVMRAAKRRKLDESSSTLSKPFKSPMRVGVDSPNPRINCKEQTVPDQRAKVTLRKANPYATVTQVDDNSLHQPAAEPPLPSSGSSPICKLAPHLSSSPGGPAKDAEYLSLQKQRSALVLQLSKLRQALDTAQQALKIQSSNTDEELELAIGKWQRISREAAEELFVGAKDRVNRLGGVGAWRQRNQKHTQRWDEDESVHHDALTDEQKDLIEEQKEEMAAMKRKYGIEQVEPAVEETEDEVGLFTLFFFGSSCSRLIAIANVVFYDGYDAEQSQCGLGAHRI